MTNNTYFATGLTYSRNTKSPLEDKKIFQTKDEVLEYITDPNQTGYIGQLVAVINDNDNTNNGLYFIDSVSLEMGDGLGSMHIITANGEFNKAQIDASFDLKADKSDTYTKHEVDLKITGGVDLSTYLTKLDASNTYTRIDDFNLLAYDVSTNTQQILNKADSSTVYSKDYIDGSLDLKADSSTVYSKDYIDSSLDLKANVSDVYNTSDINGIVSGIYNTIYIVSDDVSLNKQAIHELDMYKADSSNVYTKEDTSNIFETIEHVNELKSVVDDNTVDISTLFSTKQNTLIQGNRISIANDVISTPNESDPVFMAWLQANAAYLAVLLDEQVINPENKYLNALRQWIEIAIGGAGYEAPVYYTNIDSSTLIIGSENEFYKKISYQPELGETPIQVQSKDNIRTLVGTYLYDAQITTTVIDSGNFGFKIRCKVNNTQGTNVLEYVPFLYHVDGTRTDLFTCVSDPITNTVFLDNFKQYQSGTIHCATTDRMGVDIYFKSSASSLKTLDSLIGDGNGSYMVTPVRLRHDGLRDLDGNPNFLHVNEEQKALITSTAGIVSGHSEDIYNLQLNKQDKNKKLNDVSVNNFIDSSTYTEFAYEASITIPGVLSTHFANVAYSLADAYSTNFAPICETYDGGVKIYSKTNTEIIIKTIIVFL